MDPRKRASAPGTVYVLKIQLKRISPRIWRRIEVPGDITLSKLHRVVQTAMGWENSHLHQFTIGGVSYGLPDPDYAPGNQGRTEGQTLPGGPRGKNEILL